MPLSSHKNANERFFYASLKLTLSLDKPMSKFSYRNTIPLIVTIREPSIATQTKPISVDSRGGTVDPEFELSKKYPTVGYLTRSVNFTVTVIASMTISDQFKNFLGRVLTVRTGHGDHRWRSRKTITHYAGCNFKTYHRS